MSRTPSTRRDWALGTILGGMAAGTGLLASGREAPRVPPIPGMGRWESRMVEFGNKHRRALSDTGGPLDPLLDAVFYDAQRVFLQIADYTKDPSWLDAASRSMTVYRDRYVLPRQGKVPGFWVFPHGLAEHYRRTNDAKSREAVLLLSRNTAFAGEDTPSTMTRDVETSREVAFALMCLLEAERIGGPGRPRLRFLAEQAIGHVDQWFVSRNAAYVRPFMFALTAEALISYHARSRDRRIPEALQVGADWIWKNMWIRDAEAFQYTDRATESGDKDPAPDANLLIAPLFAWLYRWTGEERHRERGDAVFSGGVKHAWLGGNPKQFHQNYRWSFDFVKWRGAGPLQPGGAVR